MAFNVGLSGKATANADRWLRYHVLVTTVLGKTNLVQWHTDRAYQARDIYTISIAAWRLQLKDETDGMRGCGLLLPSAISYAYDSN